MEVLCKLYPDAWPDIPMSKIKETSIDKKVAFICRALKCINESWSRLCMDSGAKTSSMNMEVKDLVLATLDSMVKAAKELLDAPEIVLRQDHGSLSSLKTAATISEVPEIRRDTNTNTEVSVSTVYENVKEKCNETRSDVQVTTLPPILQTEGSVSASLPLKKGPAPPPPPPGVPRTLPQKTGPGPPPRVPATGILQFPRKGSSRLKRSTQMANLFQELKGKMDESCRAVKTTNKKRLLQLGGQSGGKQGMSASIAELTKRSTYFQQIEEDVRLYRKSILELQAEINAFQTNDMVKLVKFQNHVESILGVLSDESQVVAKFEGFPTKKLETLRAATALYSKFDTMINTLKNWEVNPPLGRLLDKMESYLKKMKLELDAFERSKDEQSKNFKRHNIEFDFLMVTRIKEAMIDLSSSCMELAIKESGGSAKRRNEKKEERVKMLWRVFEVAFRAYCFAGGQDDRANKLAKELADEILEKSPNQ